MNRKNLFSLVPVLGLVLAVAGANPTPAECAPQTTCGKDKTVPYQGGPDTLTCPLRDAITTKTKNADGSITVTVRCDYGPCGEHAPT